MLKSLLNVLLVFVAILFPIICMFIFVVNPGKGMFIFILGVVVFIVLRSLPEMGEKK